MKMVLRMEVTNAPSGNNQVLTLKGSRVVLPDVFGIGLTNVTFNYASAPKPGFWFNSATEGSEYILTIEQRTKTG